MNKNDEALGDIGALEFDFDVEVNTNMCECIPQWVNTEVCNSCGKMRYRVGSEVYPEHYGPYGENCMHTGQFDAGECWICTGKRRKVERDAALEELDEVTKRSGEMQLIAGRYQYQFEHAIKLINKVDDMFEYQFEHFHRDALQEQVQVWLAEFTDAVKIKKEFKLKGT